MYKRQVDVIYLQVHWLDRATSSVNLDWTLDTGPHSTGDSVNYCPTYTAGTGVIGLPLMRITFAAQAQQFQ